MRKFAVFAVPAALVVGGVAALAAASAPRTLAPQSDWRQDAPGRFHRVVLSDLPAPYATPSASNTASIVARPPGVLPKAPAGMTVAVYTSGLSDPREMRTAPNGDIFVAETGAGRIHVLRAPDGAAAPSASQVFADGLDEPFGMAFYPAGPNPRWLYVAELNRVVRYAYRNGALQASGAPQAVIAQIAPSTGGHSTRNLAFSADGTRLFVSIGSASNVAQEMPTKTLAQAQAYDRVHGLGATWGPEERRADVLSFTPLGGDGKVYAAGIRNCVGLAVQPGTGDLWCSTNERDALGDNLVPDYVTRVKAGAFYGWPWWYMGDHEDPRLAGQRPDLNHHVTVPDVPLQAHSASLGLTFYQGAMFPEWRHSAFAAEHGSWNRAIRTGPKLIRIPLKADGSPTGAYQDVMTGFTVDNQSVWGRPVGVAVAHDGAILVSDDAEGVIWRLSR